MVVKLSAEQRFGPPPAPLVDGRWQIYRLTRADAEALMRQGLIPEDATTELLSGMIVLKDRAATGQEPTMIGLDHKRCVELFSDLRSRVNNERRHVESQQPLVCSDVHQPEPDFMVVRGTLTDLPDLPTVADVYCVVEVADSSYERDTGEKLRAYAEAGVRQYVVVNLRNRTAEVYTEPDRAARTYPTPQIIPENGVLSVRIGEDEFLDVALRTVLPPRA
jgi:Uma2 family endonuclease